jgi:hypothetical protein
MDYLKELSNKLGGTIRSQNLSNWNLNGTSYREIIVKNYKGHQIAINDFGEVYEMGIRVESDFAFSINIPDKLFGFVTPTSIPEFPYNVYFSNDDEMNPSKNADFDLFWKAFLNKIKELILTENEGVFYYNNVIRIVLNPVQDLIRTLDYIIELINANPAIFAKNIKEKIFKKNMPENLRRFIPLMKKWSIPDDSEREQLMEETSEKLKKKLIKTVYPYMVEINKFLDSFGDEPLSHEATLLGNLAELVSELQVDTN